MTKTAIDLANLLDIMVDPEKTTIPEGGYASAVTGEWGFTRIGVVNPENWLHGEPEVKRVEAATEQIVRQTSYCSVSLISDRIRI